VGLYTRRQLVILLALVTTAGGGLAVGHWRRAHPDLAMRLEQVGLGGSGVAMSASPDGAHAGGLPSAAGGAPSTPTGVAGGPVASLPLDLNRATAEQLVDLPGVGPWLAARIVEAREIAGPFGSVDDLRRVRGFGPVRIERLRPLVQAGPALRQEEDGPGTGSFAPGNLAHPGPAAPGGRPP
jgi:competence ComEA-like helix-hairpin-helix protein